MLLRALLLKASQVPRTQARLNDTLYPFQTTLDHLVDWWYWNIIVHMSINSRTCLRVPSHVEPAHSGPGSQEHVINHLYDLFEPESVTLSDIK